MTQEEQIAYNNGYITACALKGIIRGNNTTTIYPTYKKICREFSVSKYILFESATYE